MTVITPVRFTVPGEPIAKGRPRSTRAGLHFTPKKTRTWESTVTLFASQAMRGRDLLSGPLRVVIHAYFQTPGSWPRWKREQAALENVWHITRPDEDNIGKAVKDALNQVVFNDDSQICSSATYKKYSDTPRVEVAVKHLDVMHSKSKKT